MKYKVIWSDGASKRQLPTIYGTKVGGVLFGSILEVVEENVSDREEPLSENKKWVKLTDGFFVASIYPDSTGIGKPRLEKVSEIPTPIPIPNINLDLHLAIRDGVVTSVVVDNETWTRN